MNRKSITKRCISLLCVMCVCIGVIFAQTELTNQNTKWSIVLTGKTLCKPEKTSYGMICVTDARTISSISNNGVTLWEKPITGISSPIIKTVSEDFTVTVTYSNKRITLLNPSGVGLWTKTLMWDVTETPYEGRDGRFFLRGSENLCCYGINGICKWEISTEKQSRIPIQELTDGSLVIFLEKTSDDGNGGKKTRALRISPFGKIIEEITFAGEVISSSTCSEGVLLVFSDGNGGMLSIGKNRAVNKWVLQPDTLHFTKDKNNLFISKKDMSECYFLTSDNSGNGLKVFRIDSRTGKPNAEFTVPDIRLDDIFDSDINQDGLFIMDTKNACFINSGGNPVWNGKLPDKTKEKWTYTLFTSNSELVLCYDNWSIDSYKVSQSVANEAKKAKKPSYSSYYYIDSSLYETVYKYSFNPDLISSDRILTLQTGYYGNKEIGYVSELQSALKAGMQTKNSMNSGSRVERNVFETNSAGVEKLYSQLPYFGTTDFAETTASLISAETNTALLNTIIIGIQRNGYDPEGEILVSLRNLVDSKSNLSKSTTDNICDAVYSICRFMGRPAFNRDGKKILTKLLSGKSKAKARESLNALGKLEL